MTNPINPLVDPFARNEAYERLLDNGLVEMPEDAAKIMQTTDRSEVLYDLLFSDFPDEVPDAELPLIRLIGAAICRLDSVKISLGVLGLLEGEFNFATYGHAYPYFYERLTEVSSFTSNSVKTKHLLTGFMMQDTIREFQALNGYIFPDSQRVAVDLLGHNNFNSGMQLQGDALTLPFRDETFDTVQATDLLHMLVEADDADHYYLDGSSTPGFKRPIDAYLREVRRVLKVGGSFILNEGDLGTVMDARSYHTIIEGVTIEDEITDALRFKNLVEGHGMKAMNIQTDMPNIELNEAVLGVTGRLKDPSLNISDIEHYLVDAIVPFARPTGFHFVKNN